MSFYKIKIDQSDKIFSQYIRLRDKKCQRCGSFVKFNGVGMPISHQASHFHGRAHEGTRVEPDNAICLCWGCHNYFHANPNEYVIWKKKQLGEKRFKTLDLQAHQFCKRDRKLALITARFLLKTLKKEERKGRKKNNK